MQTKLCGILHLCCKLFVELEHINHNPQTNLESVEQFSRKLTICVFNSTWKIWKKKQNFGEKDNMYCPPVTELKGLLIFATIYNPLGDLLAKLLKKRQEGGKLGIVRTNRMTGSQTNHNHVVCACAKSQYYWNNIIQKQPYKPNFGK